MAISEIFAGGGRNACGSRGSMKSGLVVEGNILSNPFAPKWKIVDEKNKEAMIWGKIMTHAALAEYGKSLYTFFFLVLPPMWTTSAAMGVICLGPWDKVHLKRIGVLRT